MPVPAQPPPTDKADTSPTGTEDDEQIVYLSAVASGKAKAEETMRIEAKITSGGMQQMGMVLVDTGNDAYNFVSRAWLDKQVVWPGGKAINYSTGPQLNICFAGTRHTTETSDMVELELTMRTPITRQMVTASVSCYIIDTKEDLILSFNTINKYFTKLTIEMLLNHSNDKNLQKQQAHKLYGDLAEIQVQDQLDIAFNKMTNKAIDDSKPEVNQYCRHSLSNEEVAEEEKEVNEQTFFGEDMERVIECKDNTEDAYQKRLEVYMKEYITAISKDLMETHEEEIRELMEGEDAKSVFTFEKWKGVNMDPIRLEFMDLPSYMKQPARPVPFEIKAEAWNALQRFIDQGNLVRADGGAYGAGLVAVWKPDKTARICGDYRQLNKYLRNIPYIIPDIHETLQQMSGFAYFAEFDWTTAFRQLPIDELTSERLAVTTPWGLYRPRFIPEGVACGSALLMQHAHKVFGDLAEWLTPVHDNILVGGTSKEDILMKTKILLKRCKEHNIQLKVKKSKIGVKSLKFFGYIVEEGRYYMDPTRIEGVQEVQFQNTQKKVQSFMGLLTFISPFIPNYSTRMSRIFEMSKNGFNFDPKTWEIDYVKD